MRKTRFALSIIFICLITLALVSTTGCSRNRGAGVPLAAVPVEDDREIPGQEIDPDHTGSHPLFSGSPGIPVQQNSLQSVPDDATGFDISSDYDGDGIPNNREVVTNPYVADYPRIVTRVAPPVTMELRVSETSVTENHSEIIEKNDTKDTISNSMENRHYTQLNEKTTPYVVKGSQSNSGSTSNSGGFSASVSMPFGGGSKVSGNWSTSESFSRSNMSEKTVFEDVDYIDNLDRNGIEFTSETVQTMARNFRRSEVSKSTFEIGPNAGLVRAGLFLKNQTMDMPVRISDVVCTLSFRTPAGAYLPVKTFKLRNEDYSEFSEEIYGGEELGPYTIEIDGLNTHEVKRALGQGYVPQVHVVSYRMNRVQDSNYNPGYENLKIVEETSKGRTAQIRVVGPGMRELHRVAAFDVDEEGRMVPGLSLKKALFRIYRDRLAGGESWESDRDGRGLTVADGDLEWKGGTVGSDSCACSTNCRGNNWRKFETYVKTWTDEYNVEHRVETIKRIESLNKYNPFNPEDNASYNPNELLEREEINKMRYWVILHNGRYFTGDLNDPIWAGERYEIVLVDIKDFNEHFEDFYYTPLQSLEPFRLNTRWNRETNRGDFARSVYLGRVIPGDAVRLEIDLEEARSLFYPGNPGSGIGVPTVYAPGEEPLSNLYRDFSYFIQPDEGLPEGIPHPFSHSVEGGTDSLKVNIEESRFAHTYEVSFRPAGTGEPWRRVAVTAEELSLGGGVVYIHRRTLDEEGEPVGHIPGDRDYEVRVTALGRQYGVDMEVASASNGTDEARVFVNHAETGIIPSGFSCSVSGREGELHVRISEALNLEYYLIRITGPQNYNSTIIERSGHPGLNVISLPVPEGTITDPGVYSVEVFGVNDSCYDGSALDMGRVRLSDTGSLYCTVPFDPYRPQREFMAGRSGISHDLTDIDLEVNFNDGTGWYRLKLSSDDYADRLIDCRFTSYMEQDRQRFVVTFRPPSGPADPEFPSAWNVFSGGREEVDVYVRTVAEPVYRESIWPVIPGQGEGAIVAPVDLSRERFLEEWITFSGSDASRMEDTLAGLTVDDPGNAAAGGFALYGLDRNSLVFSPLREMDFRVRASIMESINATQVQELDAPGFTAAAGDRSIRVTEMASQYADSFTLFWKPGNNVGEYEDIFRYPWNRSGRIDPDVEGRYRYTIEGLTPHQEYVLALRAENRYGMSAPRFYLDDPGQEGIDNLVTLIPYTTVPPAEAPTFSLNLGAIEDESCEVLVSNLTLPGECRYRVYWKKASADDWPQNWSFIDTYDGSRESLAFGPATVSIQGLELWQRYHVRAEALTLGDVAGPISETRTVVTPEQPIEEPECDLVYVKYSKSYGRRELYIRNIQMLQSAHKVTVHYSYDWSYRKRNCDSDGDCNGWMTIRGTEENYHVFEGETEDLLAGSTSGKNPNIYNISVYIVQENEYGDTIISPTWSW
jgi:hypothetical protein